MAAVVRCRGVEGMEGAGRKGGAAGGARAACATAVRVGPA